MGGLVLSLFPGIGLLDMAFEREGFCVVRGPDVLWGGDIRAFEPPANIFDGIIGGPPCQAFSRLAYMVRQNGHVPKFGNLIPHFERVVREAMPRWFVMENVQDAPEAIVSGFRAKSFVLNNRECVDEFGIGAKQNRVRRITWGMRVDCEYRELPIERAEFENPEFETAATGGSQRPNSLSGSNDRRRKKTTMPFNANSGKALEEISVKQGLPADYLKHAPFTVEAKCKAVGNGVPIPMGRAIAKAVKKALETEAK